MTLSKEYLKYFHLEYENEIFGDDKTIQLTVGKEVISDCTFNGFNLNIEDGNLALISKENMNKILPTAEDYHSSLIANTENLDSVFSYVYSKENYIKYSESYNYHVGNIDSKIEYYKSDINHIKSPITKILICDSYL